MRATARQQLRKEIDDALAPLEALELGDVPTALLDFKFERARVRQLIEALRFTLFSELADMRERQALEAFTARGGRLLPPPPPHPEDCA